MVKGFSNPLTTLAVLAARCESEVPLQGLAKYASQHLFTEAQRAGLDRERTAMLARDKRAERGRVRRRGIT
jgi:hypothetical protein